MFYSFLKILVRFVLKLFFRKIYITGIEHISTTSPQLIASNHPNGFLEPLVMACFFPKPLHFLVRGDVFDNPILAPMLRATNQIPIFRFRDGFSKLRENSQTVNESIDVLVDKKNLLIFAEGGTESIKQLRPLQKGITKIAFQALEKDPKLDLEILPIGINFTYPSKFNSEVMLRIGPPIKVRDYLQKYQDDPKTTQQSILESLTAKMKNNIVHLSDQSRIGVLEDLLIMVRSNYRKSYLPVFIQQDESLDVEISMADKIDALTTDQLSKINTKLTAYKKSLKDVSASPKDILKKSPNLVNIITLLVGFIPAVVGAATNGIPVLLSYLFTKKMVNQIEFRASILMLSNLLLFILYYIGVLVTIWMVGFPLYWVVVMIVLGLWWRYYYELFNDIHWKVSKAKITELKSKGQEILSTI